MEKNNEVYYIPCISAHAITVYHRKNKDNNIQNFSKDAYYKYPYFLVNPYHIENTS